MVGAFATLVTTSVGAGPATVTLATLTALELVWSLLVSLTTLVTVLVYAPQGTVAASCALKTI